MSNDATIATLNDLIETSKDGEYGFRSSSEHLQNPQLKVLFARRADECRQAATELQALIERLGGSPDDSGSMAGATHRGWIAVKAKLASYDDTAILEETERGEDMALESYRSALTEDLPADVRGVVQRQYEGAKSTHAEMRQLRNQARATSS